MAIYSIYVTCVSVAEKNRKKKYKSTSKERHDYKNATPAITNKDADPRVVAEPLRCPLYATPSSGSACNLVLKSGAEKKILLTRMILKLKLKLVL